MDIREQKEVVARLERRILELETRFGNSAPPPPAPVPEAPDSGCTFNDALGDWITMTEAALRMGVALGIYQDQGEPSPDQDSAVRAAIYAMSEIGAIEVTFDADLQDDRVRWNPEADL